MDAKTKTGLFGNQLPEVDPNLLRDAIEKSIEKKQDEKILEDVSQLREGQRVSIGKVLFKIQRIRLDKTIVLKNIGMLKNAD